MFLLELKGLTKRFGGLRAIEDVSFRVREGSILSVIGPNGAGKTTLFNCLTGLTRPTGGHVKFKGRDITGCPPHRAVSLGISRTFQNIRLFREMSVIENVMVAGDQKTGGGFWGGVLRTASFRRREESSKNRAFEYLELLGLEGHAGGTAGGLPYGSQRRLEIARALASEPEVLLLDEPTAGMNPQETGGMMAVIKRLQSLGKTVVLIEHDMKVVMGISERIVVLDHGVKIAEGPPKEIKENPAVIEAYLGSGA